MIYYDGNEWRDPEEMLEMASRESQEKYDQVSEQLARDGVI